MNDEQILAKAKKVKEDFENWLKEAVALSKIIDGLKNLSATQIAEQKDGLKLRWTALCSQAPNVIKAEHFELAEEVISISIANAAEAAAIQSVREKIQNL